MLRSTLLFRPKNFKLFQDRFFSTDSDPLSDLKIVKQWIDRHSWPVEVRDTKEIGRQRGVFAARSFDANEVILTEKALAVVPNSSQECSNCLIDLNGWKLPSGNVLTIEEGLSIPPSLSQHPKVVSLASQKQGCSHCFTAFCSSECAASAHPSLSLLCPSHQVEPSPFHLEPSQKFSKVWEQLTVLRKEGEDPLLPLLTMRLFSALQEGIRHGDVTVTSHWTGPQLSGGLWDFLGTLEGHPERLDLQQSRKEFQLLRDTFGSAFSPELFSQSVYVRIKSICRANSSEMAISSVQLGTPLSHDSETPLPGNPSLVTRSVSRRHGVALPTIGCFLNHSCEPNVALDIPSADSIRWVAQRSIGMGEELFGSYIPVDLSLEEKREMIFESFGFWCQCPSCERGGNFSFLSSDVS